MASDHKIKEIHSKRAELKKMGTNLVPEAGSPPFIVWEDARYLDMKYVNVINSLSKKSGWFLFSWWKHS